jgi:hypothetical protein
MKFDVESYSWIPQDFVWEYRDDIYVVEVKLSDPDLVELITKETCHITYFQSIIAFACMYKISLHGTEMIAKLTRLCNTNKCFESDIFLVSDSNRIKLHWHGSYILPNGERVVVIVSKNQSQNVSSDEFQELRNFAINLYNDYLKKSEKHKQEEECSKKEHDEFKDKILESPDFAYCDRPNPPSKPTLKEEVTLDIFPKAISFISNASTNIDALNQEILREVAQSGWNAPRDGVYHVLCAKKKSKSQHLVVNWVPYDGLPAYSELRWAVQKSFPAALEKQRKSSVNPPSFDFQEKTHAQSGYVTFNGEDDWPDALSDVELDDTKYDGRSSATRGQLQEYGFEALAWYQSFHIWNEETWGIYMDAQKIDDLAVTLFDDSRRVATRSQFSGSSLSHGQAATLAFGLSYNHELFHARVEAALTWMELNSGHPRALLYNKNVYRALLGSDDLLEEALANWASWDWLQRLLKQHPSYWSSCSQTALRVVEGVLDISPPGYRKWRDGRQRKTWRELSAQMVQGYPGVVANQLAPLEGLLSTTLPFDFRASDIPLRIVGTGTVMDRLLVHPAFFHVPARKEIERALRHFEYVRNPSGGKGSHEKWTGPDKRAFALPKRDPLSPGVFQCFLNHFNINKVTYAREVRPQL